MKNKRWLYSSISFKELSNIFSEADDTYECIRVVFLVDAMPKHVNTEVASPLLIILPTNRKSQTVVDRVNMVHVNIEVESPP